MDPLPPIECVRGLLVILGFIGVDFHCCFMMSAREWVKLKDSGKRYVPCVAGCRWSISWWQGMSGEIFKWGSQGNYGGSMRNNIPQFFGGDALWRRGYWWRCGVQGARPLRKCQTIWVKGKYPSIIISNEGVPIDHHAIRAIRYWAVAVVEENNWEEWGSVWNCPFCAPFMDTRHKPNIPLAAYVFLVQCLLFWIKLN